MRWRQTTKSRAFLILSLGEADCSYICQNLVGWGQWCIIIAEEKPEASVLLQGQAQVGLNGGLNRRLHLLRIKMRWELIQVHNASSPEVASLCPGKSSFSGSEECWHPQPLALLRDFQQVRCCWRPGTQAQLQLESWGGLLPVGLFRLSRKRRCHLD